MDLMEARTVSDLHEEIIAALDALRTRCDQVITTGRALPTQDDITAYDVAAASGVEFYEHPDIIAMMIASWGASSPTAHRRMARVPVGGDLVKSQVQGPPGFTIGNVLVLAGVPQIMRGMPEDVGHRLKGGGGDEPDGAGGG